MNIGDASAVNTLLSHLLGRDFTGAPPPDQASVRQAAEQLARGASQALLGAASSTWAWTPELVAQHWRHVPDTRQAMEHAAELLARPVKVGAFVATPEGFLDAAEELRRLLGLDPLEPEPTDCPVLLMVRRGAHALLDMPADGVLRVPREWGQSTHEGDVSNLAEGTVLQCTGGRFHEGDHTLVVVSEGGACAGA